MLKIYKGDEVRMMLGKDRGKSGKVERVLTKEGKALVSGVNTYKRHVKKQRNGREGGIFDILKPVDLSNIALVCKECKQNTRVGFKLLEGGKVRVCRKCSAEIGVIHE